MGNDNLAVGNSKKDAHFAEFHFEAWKDFSQFLDDEFNACGKSNAKPSLKDYVWRGHRLQKWELKSYFDRELEECKKEKQRSDILKQHLDSFAYACRSKLEDFGLSVRELRSLLGKSEEKFSKHLRETFSGLNTGDSYKIVKALGNWINKGILNKNHIWALGQHYGLATPLLDWCYSPYVAAFFAFEKETEKHEKKENKFRVVFGLKIEVIKRFKKIAGQEVPELEYFDPMSSEHLRLVNQRGLFTIASTGKDIEKLIEEYEHRLENESKSANKNPWLIRIEVKDTPKNRQEFLHRLNAMNINHMSLFPELQGSAQFCNLGIEFDGYAGFHGQGPL